MVVGSGKAKVAMGIQKSPVTSKQETPSKPLLPPLSPSSTKITPQKANFSRSLGVFFPRFSAQVQPRPPDVTELLRLVEELKEREARLKIELLAQKLSNESAAILPLMEKEIAAKDSEIEKASMRIGELEVENERLRKEFESFNVKMEEERREVEKKVKEMEAVIEKMTAAAAVVRREENEDNLSLSQRFQGLIDVSMKSNLIRNLKKRSVNSSLDVHLNHEHHKFDGERREESESERLGHSSCIPVEISDTSYLALSSAKSRAPRVPKPPPKPSSSTALSVSPVSTSCLDDQVLKVKTLTPPLPPPPPLKSVPTPLPSLQTKSTQPPPPPPPLPAKALKLGPNRVRRVPEVAEFYHSLMRRDSRRDASAGAVDLPATTTARDMIGEIENRSTHLLAIKTDVETQGEFIRFLIKEVESAAFTDIEDVVSFVKWLDQELSYLVDERAVLKHFEWPEKKADALREAAFGYCDLKKIETEALSFRDGARQPCGHALKKMQSLVEKLEHGVYNLSKMRESAAKRYKLFQIPIDWMLETGIVNQIKMASVKLALKYMKRVSAELEIVDSGCPEEEEEEELVIQGVKFAFRVHQFAGGFDSETMKAFQQLKDKASSCHIQFQSHPQKNA